jgi:hypothetical protein
MLNKIVHKPLIRKARIYSLYRTLNILPVWPMYFVRHNEIFNYTKCINLHRTFKVTSSQNLYISKLLWSLQKPVSLIMHMFRTVTVSAVLYILIARLINSINCLLKILLAECWHQFQINFLCVSDNSTYATRVLLQMHENILLWN